MAPIVYVLLEDEPDCAEFPVVVVGVYLTKKGAKEAMRVRKAYNGTTRPHADIGLEIEQHTLEG